MIAQDGAAVKGLSRRGYFEGINLIIDRYHMNTKTTNPTADAKLRVSQEILRSFDLTRPGISSFAFFFSSTVVGFSNSFDLYNLLFVKKKLFMSRTTTHSHS